jgi:hypothetical protein
MRDHLRRQPQLSQRPRPRRLDHHVRDGEQRRERTTPGRRTEIQHHAAMPPVQPVEEPSLTHPATVRPVRRLDLDDVRPRQPQQPRAQRPRPHRRQINHHSPLEPRAAGSRGHAANPPPRRSPAHPRRRPSARTAARQPPRQRPRRHPKHLRRPRQRLGRNTTRRSLKRPPRIAGTAPTSSARLRLIAHHPSAARSSRAEPPADTRPRRRNPATAARPATSSPGSARTSIPVDLVTAASSETTAESSPKAGAGDATGAPSACPVSAIPPDAAQPSTGHPSSMGQLFSTVPRA